VNYHSNSSQQRKSLKDLLVVYIAKNIKIYTSQNKITLPSDILQLITEHYIHSHSFTGGPIPSKLLQNIPTFEQLDFNGKPNVNETLFNFANESQVKSIKLLNLSSTKVTLNSLNFLLQKIQVDKLVLDRCYSLSREDVLALFGVDGFQHVKKLSLRYLNITNHHLFKRDALKHLQELNIEGCKFISKGGIKDFKAEIPTCQVITESNI